MPSPVSLTSKGLMNGPSASSVNPACTKLKWAKSAAFSTMRPAEACQRHVPTMNTRRPGSFQSSSGQGGGSATGSSRATHTAPYCSRTRWRCTPARLGMAPPGPSAGMKLTVPVRSYCHPW